MNYLDMIDVFVSSLVRLMMERDLPEYHGDRRIYANHRCFMGLTKPNDAPGPQCPN